MATAQPISEAVGRKVAIVDELDEMNFGELEGRTFQEIAISRPLLYERWMTTPTAVHFPGGESFDAMRTRSLAAVSRIRRVHAAASVLAVSHAGPIRAILGDVLQLPDSSMFRLEISPASITVIDWIDDQPIVRLVNMVPGAAALALTSRTDSEESAIATKMLGDVRTPA
jgi:probable phosphoglycerate mutase